MSVRTDLALEMHEMSKNQTLHGVKISEHENEDCKATVIEIVSEEGQKAIGKPVGTYITLEMNDFPDAATITDGRLSMLRKMLDSIVPSEGTALVAGLGNPAVTPDAIGPLCADSIIATRHLEDNDIASSPLPSLRSVCVISPGVTGKTGIETGEIIAGIKEKIKPSVIILIDALAARNVSRLGSTVQLSSTGLQPGSGVGNKRKAINFSTMGVPVIAIGIPTVVDAETLCYDLTGQTPDNDSYRNMMVTPKDTDVINSGGARLISLALNMVLQKNLTAEEIISLTMP